MAREVFNSKMGAIAAAAGSAVGLGNIWRFPYVLGENGGGAFLFVYILFTFLIAVPILLSELAIGRRAGKPVLGAFKALAPGTKWHLIGYSGVFCAFLILSFYAIVSGWTLLYAYRAVVGELAAISPDEMTTLYNHTSSDPVVSIIWMFAFIGLTAFVVMRGVQDGIEKYSKILMPMLLLLIVLLCIRALTLPGALDGLAFLLKPDFSKLTFTGIFEALGQAFFSLSIGMGTMTTYGSYISRKQNLVSGGFSIAGLDFMIAFLAAVIIFPCAFSFGISPGQGPGLVFVTLPNIFNQIFMGRAVSIVFFVLLSVAALTSTISLLEVVVSFLVSERGFRRKPASLLVAGLIGLLGCLCAFSSTIFSLFDNISANILLPGGALFIVLFIPHVLGKEAFRSELEACGTRQRVFGVFYFVIKYIVPVAVGGVLIYQIVNWLIG